MNREIKTFTTPSGVEIVLNAYMTGGEVMDLEAAIASSAEMRVDGGKSSMSMKTGDVLQKRLKTLIGIVVVSVAGETDKEKIWNAIRDLRSNEYAPLMKEIDAIAEGVSTEDAKK